MSVRIYCCGRMFYSDLELAYHRKERHGDGEVFPCPYCKRDFDNAWSREKHICGVLDVTGGVKEPEVTKIGFFRCPDCGISYMRKSTYNSHDCDKRKDKSMTTKRHYVHRECKDCGTKVFFQNDVPEEHKCKLKKSAKNSKMTYSCGKCGNGFPKIDAYEKHACVTKEGNKKKIPVAVLVSPYRQDEESFERIIKTMDPKAARFLVRGLEIEKKFIDAAKKAGAEVIVCDNKNKKIRDMAMLAKSEIVLVFPNWELYPKSVNKQFKLKADSGPKTEFVVVVYPDIKVGATCKK